MKIFRKKLKISNNEIENFANLKNKSSIYYLESTYRKSKIFKYLLLLRKYKVNINEFLDEELKEVK